ncbi:MAG: phosphate ABC transporter permease PstA [Devosia sp.]
MSDIAAPRAGSVAWDSDHVKQLRKRRSRLDLYLRIFGIGSIIVAFGMLATLIVSLVATGYPAFLQTEIRAQIYVDPAEVNSENFFASDWRSVFDDSLRREFSDLSNAEFRQFRQLYTQPAPFLLRDELLSDPSVVGQTIEVEIPAADIADQFNKGRILRETPENRRRINDFQIHMFDRLKEQGLVSAPFNWGLFLNSDSRFPELAGLRGAIVGSFYALLVCFLLSFPMGVAAAVYLEEFAPKNRLTDIVEVNINNLAAVPSVIFGLLGLAVFLNFLGLPRSAPLVGGMVLALMTLPTIIIATRSALRSVPPSIREAALGMGASKHEMIVHHVLPLALPGILTGTIIGLAQALGETAPLLLIGMNAFLTSPPGGIADPATALPTQIYIWADSPERGFVSRTSAGILVLLGFLITMNAIAVFLRARLQRNW